MERVGDRVGSPYRLFVMGDLRGWVGDRVSLDITCAFGVSRENDNGRKVGELYAEMRLCVSNTSFKLKILNK